ncbi:MAG: cytochrome ubiquinol oxidase subunit II [Planctomycetes bacterium]|nr:cytochrome ubiquinol oxidase subunit II [Planctomycetota bacterium]
MSARSDPSNANRYCSIAVAAKAGLLLPLVCGLTACSGWSGGFLDPAGPVAEAQRNHFFTIIAWTSIVILPLFVAFPWVLRRYRHGNGEAPYRPEWEFSWLLEVLVWGVPVVIVAILGWNLWRQAHQSDPYRPISSAEAPLQVDVIGLDWKWLFVYPSQGIATADTLVLPAGRPVQFRLTSATVLQSFMIPRLGSQIYVMPGMKTELNLMADRPGNFIGLNTQYNGAGFARQRFTTKALGPKDFASWVTRVQDRQPALDKTALGKLMQRSTLDRPLIFGKIPANLFQTVLQQTAKNGMAVAQ